MANLMSEIFDTTTLVTIAIAVIILLRLRATLGTRNGNERPPFEPYEIDRKTRKAKPAKTASPSAEHAADVENEQGNVIAMPNRDGAKRATAKVVSASDQAINEYAKTGTKLNAGLKEIAATDPSFTPLAFIDGAKMAYEMIVTSFADGDRKTLKNLLSREVYDGFAAVISDRESRKEQVRSSFVGIEETSIKSAGVFNNDAQITIEFISQIISSTINSAGEIIDGDPEHVGEVRDIWTFAKDVRSRDPNWKLVATESDS